LDISIFFCNFVPEFTPKMRKLVFTVFFLTSFLMVMAAGSDYIIEIKPTKKILHVNQLGFGESTPIMDVLETMPELLGRASDDGSILSNFSIQIDGRDVGQSRDVVLMQTIVAEVDVIEISTSPTVSEQQNGTGGKINIKLKPIEQDGTSGMAILDVATSWDVQPSVLVNYKTDKFLLRSSVRAEYYRPTNYGYSRTDNPNQIIEAFDTTNTSYKQETAKLFMKYTPTKNDELTVNVWESYSRSQNWTNVHSVGMLSLGGDDKTFSKYDKRDVNGSKDDALAAEAFMGYKHTYLTHGGEVKVEARYSYMPTNSQSNEFNYAPTGLFGGDSWDSISSQLRQHQVIGEVSDKHVVYQQDKDKVDFKYGVNVTYGFGSSFMEHRSQAVSRPVQCDTFQNNNSNLYASPYMEMNYSHGVWYFQAGARYQYYRVNFADKNITTDYSDNHTWTGNLSLSCNVVKDHHLRLMLARNIRREVVKDEINIYPYYDADLNYIFEWANAGHKTITSVSANYIYAAQAVGYTGTARANAQLIYQYGIFSMAFAGNVYLRTPYQNSYDGKRCFYYNLSLQPVFMFPKQWNLSGKITYNSKVEYLDETYGDCVYTQIRVGKQIRGWNIHAEIDDIFGYTTYNSLRLEDGTRYTSLYDLYPRSFRVGFSYTF